MKIGRIVLVVGSATLFLCLVWFKAHQEPTYQGKELSKWLLDLDLEAAGKPMQTAEMAIRKIGTNGLPVLMRMLERQDSPMKLWLVRLSQRQSVVRLHFVDENERVRCVVKAFEALGSVAEPIVGDLTNIIRDPKKDPKLRCVALIALGKTKVRNKSIALILTRALGDPDNAVRSGAALILWENPHEPSIAIPALVTALKDRDPIVRNNSAAALASFGDEAQIAIRDLKDLLLDSDPRVRQMADFSINKIYGKEEGKTGTWWEVIDPEIVNENRKPDLPK